MRSSCKVVSLGATFLLAALLTPAAFAAKAHTFTGTLSDAMCGAKHMMAGDDASCLKTCISRGSKYALVVGDKVYTLDTGNQATLDTLGKLGPQKITVKGTVDGDTITVRSVTAAK
ncbi:MAG: hypothetical protein ACRD3L_07420 [Terriglobales bacterium]